MARTSKTQASTANGVKLPPRPAMLKEVKPKKKVAAKPATAKLTIGDKISVDLPIYKATAGASCIDVTSLYKDTGYFTYDPGFLSTASCDSEITYIDGGEGILRYRGYDIDELANMPHEGRPDSGESDVIQR